MTHPNAGKVALVTGASSGIGEAVALALAEQGAAVALAARRGDRLEAIAARIAGAGGTALALPGDIADEAFAHSIVDRTVERFGRIDILVNAAGVMPEGGVTGADAAQWRRVIEINVLGSLHTCQAAAAQMRIGGSGDIINISSTSGRRVAGVFGLYSTSKHALNAMSESLRQEVGGDGIRVCVIEPGATETELYGSVGDPALRQAVQQLSRREGSLKVQDVADAVMFVLALPPRANVSELLLRPTGDVAAL